MTEVGRREGRIGGSRWARWALFLGIAAIVVILDQASKAVIVAGFEPASRGAPPGTPGGPTQVVGDLLRITVTHNDGGIFGLAGSSAPILALASVAVIGAIVWYEGRQGLTGGPLLTIVLGLLLGGAIGNLVDRARHGYVVDWVDAGIGDLRWYVFNVADSAISLAIVGLIAIGFLGDRLGRWGPEAPGTPGDAPPAGGGAPGGPTQAPT